MHDYEYHRTLRQMIISTRCYFVVPFLAALLPATTWSAVVVNPVLAPNPNRIPMGDIGALEGGAIVARTSDAAATYYNPAGLVRALQPSISGNASLYEVTNTTYSSASGDTKSSTFDVVPSYVGAVGWFSEEKGHPGIAWGLAITNPVAWKSVVETTIDDPANDYYISNHGQAEINTLAPTFGLGWAVNRDISLGASIQGLYTTQSTTVAEQERQPGIGYWRNYATVNQRTIIQARFALGASWRATDRIVIGAQVRSPTVLIHGSRDARLDELTVTDAGTPSALTTNSSGRLAGGDADLKRPTEAALGISYSDSSWSVEIDINARAAISTYKTSNAGVPIHTSTIDATGNVTNDVSDYPGGETSDSAVINGAIGGSYVLNSFFSLHAGFFSDRSSVKDSSIYQKINLYCLTFGISYTGEHSSVSFGGAYTWSDKSDAGDAFDPYSGTNQPTSVRVRILGAALGAKYFF